MTRIVLINTDAFSGIQAIPSGTADICMLATCWKRGLCCHFEFRSCRMGCVRSIINSRFSEVFCANSGVRTGLRCAVILALEVVPCAYGR